MREQGQYYSDTIDPFALPWKHDTVWGVFTRTSHFPIERGLTEAEADKRVQELAEKEVQSVEDAKHTDRQD